MAVGILAATACCVFPATSVASVQGAPDPSPLNGLHVSGNRFVDDNGQPVTLRGAYYTGFDSACVHGNLLVGAPLTVSAIEGLLSWHINAVRIGVAEDCWLGINGAPSGGSASAYQRELLTWIDLLHSYGIYTEIGLIYAAPGGHLSDGQAPMPDEDHSVAFWSSFASYFKNEPDTALGLYGEPHPDATATANPWACWRDGGSSCNVKYGLLGYTAAGMQQLVDTIRATGSTLPITVSGIHWAEDFSKWLQYEPSDPQHQLAAEWHQYGDVPCFGSGDVMEANTSSCWNDADLQVLNTVPMLNGEAGEYAHSNKCAWQFMPTYLAWAEAHHVSYLVWRWGPTDRCDNMALNQDYTGTPTPVYGQGYQSWLAQVTAAASGSVGGGGVSPGQRCDRAVAFAPAAQNAMAGAPIRYRVTITNVGTAACASTKLDVWADRATRAGSSTTLARRAGRHRHPATCRPPGGSRHRKQKCLVLTVARLPAGASVTYSLHATQPLVFSPRELGSATVRAAIAAGGESASATTMRVLAGITNRTAAVDSRGGAKRPFACGRPAGDPCHITGLLETPSRTTRRALVTHPARSQLMGDVRGLVRGASDGRIAISLNRAGRRLLQSRRQIRVLLVLTVRSGGQVSTLAYPISLRVS